VVENVRRAIGEKAEMGRNAMSVRGAIVSRFERVWRFEWYCSERAEYCNVCGVIEVGDRDMCDREVRDRVHEVVPRVR
jgi:hypothetical protein